jgi:hypothetical protein
VSRGILLAFWALETDFGAFQGDYNTLIPLLLQNPKVLVGYDAEVV